MKIPQKLANLIVKTPFLYTGISGITHKDMLILVDYPIKPHPRYGYGKPPHPVLYNMINRNRAEYLELLKMFLELKDCFIKIPLRSTNSLNKPYWYNTWIPGLDLIAIYGFIYRNKPKVFFEIGSGNSTKIARKAILDNNLRTTITSIDPHPRVEIDKIADVKIRSPLEDIDTTVFEQLEAQDILFIDCSHRCFTNSDVTVIFLEVLPKLKPGVLLGFHDIFLPNDYPPEWNDRYYSEQYLLASYLMAGTEKASIVFPSNFISQDSDLSKVLEPIWNDPNLVGIQRQGWSFWIEIK